MLFYLVEYLEIIADVIDLIGIFIVLIGAAKFLIHAVPIELRRLKGAECAHALRHLRLQLGSYIILAIEFMIVSDIIQTALSRTLDDLYYLMGLVVIRTAISYFLGKELTEVQDSKS